ncbi:MAG: hypothetical protein CMQ27_02025 [Gammaproteobacteria bacterium]|nr:hypothetical protein [Gammaproteobacteria bacterium]
MNNELFCLVLNVFCSLRKGRDRDFVAIQRTPSKKIKVQSDMPQIWDNKHQMGALRPVLVSTILKKTSNRNQKALFRAFMFWPKYCRTYLGNSEKLKHYTWSIFNKIL